MCVHRVSTIPVCTTCVCTPSVCAPSLCAPPVSPTPHTRPRLTLLCCTHRCPGDTERPRAPQLPPPPPLPRCPPDADTELSTSTPPPRGPPAPIPTSIRGHRRGAERLRLRGVRGRARSAGRWRRGAHRRVPPPLTRGATAAPSRGGDRGMERRRRPRSQPRGVSRCNFGNRHQKYRPARRDLKAVGARK